MWQRYVFCTGCRIWRDGPLTRWKAYEPTSTNLLFLDSEPTLPERRLGRHVVMRITSLRPGFEGIPDVLSGYCNLVRGLQPGAVTISAAAMEPLRVGYRDLLRYARNKYFYSREELPVRLAWYMFDNPTL